jgi:serine/threonine protein kinase/tetratricopeptide (TPR) repeat protein
MGEEERSAEDLFAEYVARREDGEEVEFEEWVLQCPADESELRRLYKGWPTFEEDKKGVKGVSFFRPRERKRPQSAPELEVGRTVGDFKLASFIGKGGMGQVWEAEQISLGGRRVAIKFVRPELVTPRHLELFRREARAGGRLNHDGIVRVHGYGESGGLAWIAMEYVDGCWTLRDFIDQMVGKAELPEDYDGQVARFIAEIATAMQAAHDAGVTHRDLKPQNILVAEGDQPKIADFGLARIADEDALSRTGDLAGSDHYMSPEQVTAGRTGIDHRSDIFSLGVVLYEMVALRRPFQGHPKELADQIVTKDPPDLRSFRLNVSEDLSAICSRALEKDRGRRYQAMRDLASDLRRIEGRESGARPGVLPPSGGLAPNSCQGSGHAKRGQPGSLAPPVFEGHLERRVVARAIDEAIHAKPIVAVEGLSGTGKTSSLAAYLSNDKAPSPYHDVYWYGAERGGVLLDLLEALESELSLRRNVRSAYRRCQAIASFLIERNAVLVVDDFHLADQPAFGDLFRAVAGVGDPARLILVSQTRTVSADALGKMGNVTIRGFELSEVSRYLEAMDVRLDRPVLRELEGKSDGLPLAISLFCVLIRSGQFGPNDLLRAVPQGGGDRTLELWFESVKSLISAEEYRLLQGVSIAGGRFGLSLRNAVSQAVGVVGADDAFANLESCYLVQRYPHETWTVHSLVQAFCRDGLTAGQLREKHEVLTKHYTRRVQVRLGRRYSDEEFFDLERAARHLQEVGLHPKAEKIMRALSGTAKGRGFYGRLRRLCKRQIDDWPDRSRWNDYDYAHCCLITGDAVEAERTVRPIIREDNEPDLRVQIARLYAEIMLSMDKAETGLAVLERVIDETTDERLSATVQSQCMASLSQVLTALGRLEEARKWAQRLVATAEGRGGRPDWRGSAVGRTRLGIIASLSGDLPEAREQLERAVELFRGQKDKRGRLLDRRGLAWSLLSLSPCLLRSDAPERARSLLLEALVTKRDISEVSPFYLSDLHGLAALDYGERVQRVIEEERVRVEDALQQ